jgi:wobble nucleotide-excising tRNase
VLDVSYESIDDAKQAELEKLINEALKNPVPKLQEITLCMDKLSAETRKSVEKRIGTSDRIVELIRDTALNSWVKTGLELHKGKREICSFCGNYISDSRWVELSNHFDKESKDLENVISNLIDRIDSHKEAVKNGFNVDNNLFYSKYYAEIDALKSQYRTAAYDYQEQLEMLISQLRKRIGMITIPIDFNEVRDNSEIITKIWTSYEILRNEKNNYTDYLYEEQKAARERLRLHEVEKFVNLVNYKKTKEKIDKLKNKVDKLRQDKKIAEAVIENVKREIRTNKNNLHDEEKGAAKVNEYLNGFFGHGFLSLHAVEDTHADSKIIKFEIIRDGKKAYHLSEGECSLIAFCYFVAKLDDTNTKGTKPIIWIDDPVSSLDGNHIFFIYSLIVAEIFEEKDFEQLFISTHNLDFLKYLKRISCNSKNYFLVLRQENCSTILEMPAYMRKYVTEFNFLFHQIYKCSRIKMLSDTDNSIVYSFANNARKFLEIYLFYKYPNNDNNDKKLERFFGVGKVPVILIKRISNEYSHLCGDIERASMPVSVPEMVKVATLIINRLKEWDFEQYTALLESIGENTHSETEEYSIG